MKRIKLEKGLDILGDGHGCLKERIDLIEKAGYARGNDGLYRHPDGRKLVYLNDEANKGDSRDSRVIYGEFPSVAMVNMMKEHVQAGLAYAVNSNNNEKVYRFLENEMNKNNLLNNMLFAVEMNNLQKKYGIEQAKNLQNELLIFCKSLPSYVIVEDNTGRDCAVITHAGILDEMIGKDSKEIKTFCSWGGSMFDIPNWVELHQSDITIIWGHKPHSQPKIQNNTINIDTGGYFGKFLTMLRFPEMEFVQQKVETSYEIFEEKED